MVSNQGSESCDLSSILGGDLPFAQSFSALWEFFCRWSDQNDQNPTKMGFKHTKNTYIPKQVTRSKHGHDSPEGENDHDVQYLTMKEFDFTHAEHNGLAAHRLTTLPKVRCANGVMVSAEDSEATDLSSNLGGILFFLALWE